MCRFLLTGDEKPPSALNKMFNENTWFFRNAKNVRNFPRPYTLTNCTNTRRTAIIIVRSSENKPIATARCSRDRQCNHGANLVVVVSADRGACGLSVCLSV